MITMSLMIKGTISSYYRLILPHPQSHSLFPFKWTVHESLLGSNAILTSSVFQAVVVQYDMIQLFKIRTVCKPSKLQYYHSTDREQHQNLRSLRIFSYSFTTSGTFFSQNEVLTTNTTWPQFHVITIQELIFLLVSGPCFCYGHTAIYCSETPTRVALGHQRLDCADLQLQSNAAIANQAEALS